MMMINTAMMMMMMTRPYHLAKATATAVADDVFRIRTSKKGWAGGDVAELVEKRISHVGKGISETVPRKVFHGGY